MNAPNPFTPGFGQVPYCLAGRDSIIADLQRAFDLSYRDPSLTSIFIGTRGTGKTALITRLGTEAKQRGWITVDAVARTGMLEDIFQRSEEAAAPFLDAPAKKRLSALSIGGIGSIEWQTEPAREKNWRGKMAALLDELAETDKGLLITVDELDPTFPEVAELISVYQLFVREDRKIGLLLAGLPGKIVSLLNRRDVSFIRRAKRYRLGSIPDAEVLRAFTETITMGGRSITDDAADEATRAIGGFAYMLQAVGYRAWDDCKGDSITLENVRTGARVAQKELEDGVLESTYYELSAGDRAFLHAMLEDTGESAVADIIARTGKSASAIQKTRRRLIDLGVLGERGRGFLDFDLPYFKEYLANRLDR